LKRKEKKKKKREGKKAFLSVICFIYLILYLFCIYNFYIYRRIY